MIKGNIFCRTDFTASSSLASARELPVPENQYISILLKTNHLLTLLIDHMLYFGRVYQEPSAQGFLSAAYPVMSTINLSYKI